MILAELPEVLLPYLQSKKRGGRHKGANATGLGARPAWLEPGGVAGTLKQALQPDLPPIGDVRAAIEAIPNGDVGWDDYNRILMAIWSASGGSDAGSRLAHAWATKSSKYRLEDVDSRWQHYATSPPTEIGYGSLWYEAQKANLQWTPPSRKRVENSALSLKVKATNGVPNDVPDQLFETAATHSKQIFFPDLNDKGKPRATCINTRIAIQSLGLSAKFDCFHDKMWLGGQALGDYSGELSDNAVLMLRAAVRQTFGYDPGRDVAYDAAVQECLVNSYDPVQDYLDSLVWDGVARLKTWLSVYMGADRTPLNNAIGALALVAAVRRVRRPGAKFDQIIVLIGPEGQGKSRALEILAGRDNFSDQEILTLDERRQQEQLQGVWLYEIGELAGLHRADAEKVKAFASRAVDRCRPAYGRVRVDKPRRTIFFASTNHKTFLKSQTGNRRFWPVDTRHIDLEALNRDRDQIWAEACRFEATGMAIELPKQFWKDAAVEQEKRMDQDPWIETLADLETKTICKKAFNGYEDEWRVFSRDIMDIALRLPIEKQSDVTAKRLAFAMERAGWHGPKTMRAAGLIAKGYTKPAPAK